MEAGLEQYLKEKMNITDLDLKNYSPLTLAYMGDSVFDMVIKTVVVSKGNMQVNKYHKITSSIVKAQAQASMVQGLIPYLSQEEISIYKRGRNAQSYTKAKNASMIDYRMATGLEALIGYLYLNGEYTRLVDLIKIGLECLEQAGEKK